MYTSPTVTIFTVPTTKIFRAFLVPWKKDLLKKEPGKPALPSHFSKKQGKNWKKGGINKPELSKFLARHCEHYDFVKLN